MEQIEQKIEPHEHLERKALGLILAAPDTQDAIDISRLRFKDFQVEEHQSLFAAILGLSKTIERIGVIELSVILKANKVLETPNAYLNELMNEFPIYNAIELMGCSDTLRRRTQFQFLKNIGKEIFSRAERGLDNPIEENPITLRDKVYQQLNHLEKEDIGKPFEPISDVMMLALDQIEERFKGKALTDLKFGLPTFDNRFDVLVKKNFVVIAARPSMGKTSLALKAVLTSALAGRRCLVISIEMNKLDIAKRLLAINGTNLNISALDRGSLGEESWQHVAEAAERIMLLPISIADEGVLDIHAVRNKVKLSTRTEGVELIVLDYLQLMSQTNPKDNRNQALSEISRQMKVLAEEYDVCILCLSQLSRENEKRSDKRPILSDLRDSGAIEQDADAVIFIYRDEMYHPETHVPGIAELIVRKNRNGPTGEEFVRWKGPQTLFEE